MCWGEGVREADASCKRSPIAVIENRMVEILSVYQKDSLLAEIRFVVVDNETLKGVYAQIEREWKCTVVLRLMCPSPRPAD